MSFDPELPQDGHNVSPTHPLREAVVLVVAVTALGAGFVVAAALAVNLLIPLLPTGLEVWIFSSLPVAEDDDEDTEDSRHERKQLEALIARLERHWADNPYEYRVILWDEAQPNAVAFPGGWIAVTRGLLEQVESENELAFVLGHELGHFRNRDHLRGLGRGVALALLASAISQSGAGSAAQLATLAGELAQRGYDRDQEREADRFGLGLVAAEYGHVAGASDFFASLPDGGEVGFGEEVAGYLSTHPVSSERVEALREIADREGWSRAGELLPVPDLRATTSADAASVPP